MSAPVDWSKASGEIRIRFLLLSSRTLLNCAIESIPQKCIVTHGVAANRLDPLAGIWRAAIFNTARRVFGQVLFVAPPFLVAYGLMNWANERYES